MRQLTSVLVAAMFLGGSYARGDQGDDLIAAWGSGNTKRPLELAEPAALKGDYIAQFVLGRVYEAGRGAPKDTTEANKWFQKALLKAKPAAEGGDRRAQYVLGRMYEGGWAVPKDQAQAVALYRKSADKGYSWAQGTLGACYLSGEGVAKDDKAAAVFYRKAADQGNAWAQTNLGVMYENGHGVAMDATEAVAWYRKAADQGEAFAQTNLGMMYVNGLGVSKDDNAAIALFRKSAEQGYAGGQRALGWMHENGRGVSKDEKKAVALYREAAEQGDASAQNNLGLMYENGHGISKNVVESASWYRKAAEQGDAVGQNNLGVAYRDGLGLANDDVEAISWFRKSAAQGNSDGQVNLAWMYHMGRGVLKDDREAVTWFRKAGEQGNAIALKNLREVPALRDLSAAVASAPKPAAEAPAPKSIVSDVDTPGYTTPENADNFAVVIGAEKYASLPAADFAERDAESVRAHLMAMGYPARNIYFLSGQQATRAKIAQSVNSWLPGRVGPNSSVFFYYSGHGAPDARTNQAYLVPTDGDPEDLDSTAYPIKLLYEKLGKLKTKQVIVALDSCFSGAGGRSVLAKGTRPLVAKIDMGGLPENVIALTASDKSQISGTIEDQGHGAFTYYMLKGLEGAAKNDSGKVTLQSLHAYLTPKVQDAARLQNRDQTPQLMNAKGAGAALR